MLPETQPTSLPGVLTITPRVFPDDRGFFMEIYHRQKYAERSIGCTFVQDNHSHSCRGTLRGLHYQLEHPQGKLVWVVRGEILDVAVDIRRGSPTFGQWVSQVLSTGNHAQLFVPEGFAHGFCVLSEEADVLYKCTDFYVPEDDHGLAWNDPELGIDWPIPRPLLSPKDRSLPHLRDIPPAKLPRFSGSDPDSA